MNQETVIQKTIDFIKEVLSDAEGGHDWWHIYRVWKLSKYIAQTEEVDIFIVELAPLHSRPAGLWSLNKTLC